IPEIPRKQRRSPGIAVRDRPDSALAEAYRSVRSAITLMPRLPVILDPDESRTLTLPLGRGSRPPGLDRLLAVTSPTSGLGKTRTATNLAAAFAEAGRSVLLIDADLRNPGVHTQLGLPNGRGLSDLLASGEVADLPRLLADTPLPGVRVLTAGSSGWAPATLWPLLGEALALAEHQADIVVIDSAPLLGASDATELTRWVDAILVVVWAGRVRLDHAQRSAELLGRIGVPVVGAALITREVPRVYPSGQVGPRWRSGRRTSTPTPALSGSGAHRQRGE
ncbi:MAG: CpsD/CapB family tyrosine-protein kinase, partial [Actinomycetes bacterium]